MGASDACRPCSIYAAFDPVLDRCVGSVFPCLLQGENSCPYRICTRSRQGRWSVYRPLKPADSGGGSICFEEFDEYLAGFTPLVNLTGPIVDLGRDGGEVVWIAGDDRPLGKVLTDDPVKVLVAASLPR